MSLLIYAPTGIAVKPLSRVFEHSGIAHEICSENERSISLAAHGNYSVFLVIHTGTSEELLDFHSKWKQLGGSSAFIVLTPRQSGVERVRALHAGVTSYHITPFSYTQLVHDVAQYEYVENPTAHLVEVHGLSVDYISKTVKFKGEYLHITKKQYELLALLVRNPGHIYSRVQIWEHVWSTGEYPLANTVDVHVNRLRKQLPEEAQGLIETVYGFGYRLKPSVELALG